MSLRYRPYKLKEDPLLEQGEARVIYTTYLVTQDKQNMSKQIKAARQWFDEPGIKRIKEYLKRMNDGEMT